MSVHPQRRQKSFPTSIEGVVIIPHLILEEDVVLPRELKERRDGHHQADSDIKTDMFSYHESYLLRQRHSSRVIVASELRDSTQAQR